MRNYFTTSKAIRVFDKIQTKLESFGYKLNRSSDIETYKYKNDVIEFCQKYKFSQFDTNTFGKFLVKDSAPELKLCLLAEKDDLNNRLEYDITAILGDSVWAGRDTSLQDLVDAYLDDAYSDIANYYADTDQLDLVDSDDDDIPVYENLKNHLDLDKLDKQIKESNDLETLEDLNTKVDTILDALGLADTVVDDKDNLDEADNDDGSSDNDVIDVVDLTNTDNIVTEDTEQTVEDTDSNL